MANNSPSTQVKNVQFGNALDNNSAYLICADKAVSAIIGFPSMPEALDLVRENEYDTFQVNPLFPDGYLALYRGSQPISIPFSFTVSMHDNVNCSYGPLDLVNTARILHAMAEPTIDAATLRTVLGAATIPTSGAETGVKKGANAATAPPSTTVSLNDIANNVETGTNAGLNSTGGNYFMPPSVNLVIFAANSTTGFAQTAWPTGSGLSFVGYLKNVKTSLRGPWVQAEGFAGRLPSSGEFSFTFVYFPSYTGSVPAPLATTSAPQVMKYFFGESAPIRQPATPP